MSEEPSSSADDAEGQSDRQNDLQFGHEHGLKHSSVKVG
jgi:hypothetical protein